MAHMLPPYMPSKTTPVLRAFPANVEDLMPAPEHVPAEFWNEENKWVQLVHVWFYNGAPQDSKYYPSGAAIPTEDAFWHVQCILGSFQPKHEHKVATAAFLSSLWFSKVEFPGVGVWP